MISVIFVSSTSDKYIDDSCAIEKHFALAYIFVLPYLYMYNVGMCRTAQLSMWLCIMHIELQ